MYKRQTLTVWFVVPCLVALAASALLRLRAAVIVNVVVLAVLLVWTGPDLRWWSSGPGVDGPTAVVASSNIAGDHDALDESAATLTRIDADVLNVVELTPAALAALHDAGITERYPYRFENPRNGAFGSGIYSRYPLRDAEDLVLAGAHMVKATVEMPFGATTVVAVHTMQPLANLDDLRAQMAALEELAADTDGPLILAGDFNASRQHATFRALLDSGLTDAHLSTGRGWAASWPEGRRLPPFALIDHVLVSDELAVDQVTEVRVPASDHRALVAVVGRAAS